VEVSRSMLTAMAIGTAEKNNIHFFNVRNVEMYANAALKARSEVKDRSPEHASTTWRVVSARCRMFPSL